LVGGFESVGVAAAKTAKATSAKKKSWWMRWNIFDFNGVLDCRRMRKKRKCSRAFIVLTEVWNFSTLVNETVQRICQNMCAGCR